MEKKENGFLKGWIEINHYDSQGNLIEQIATPNVITNVGLAEAAGLLVGDVTGMTKFDYMAIGTGTAAATATDTQLQTEITDGGGERAGTTGTRVTTSVTNDTSQFVTTYSFTGSYTVTESGVLNAASTGTMLCRQTFSAINVANGDSLQVTWKVQCS